MSKNPYEENTPEWQLFANMKQQEHLVNVYHDDVERYTEKRDKAAKMFDRYKNALDKLTK